VRRAPALAGLRRKCEIELEEHTSVARLGEADGIPGELPGSVEVLDAELEPTVDARGARARQDRGRRPAWGKELDESILPAEAGLDETHISFTKGCYPGQEPIARLRHRGHVNRRLRVLEVDDARPGVEIAWEGKTVGRVTSAVAGPRAGVRTDASPGRRAAHGRRRHGTATLTVPRRP
jgi:folate-binding protein YgfZ